MNRSGSGQSGDISPAPALLSHGGRGCAPPSAPKPFYPRPERLVPPAFRNHDEEASWLLANRGEQLVAGDNFAFGRTTSREVAGVAYLRPVPCPRCAGPREVA